MPGLSGSDARALGKRRPLPGLPGKIRPYPCSGHHGGVGEGTTPGPSVSGLQAGRGCCVPTTPLRARDTDTAAGPGILLP